MRVLHLIKGLGRGGAEVLLKEGLAVADRHRFEYSYAYLQTRPDQVAEELRSQGVRVDCLHMDGNVKMLLNAMRVARYLGDQDINLVHAHLPLAGVVARFAGRVAKVPVVYTEHNLQDRYHRVVRQLNLLTWGWQEQVVAISDDVAESIRRNAGDRVPVQTVLNGVNTRKFAASHFRKDCVRRDIGIPVGAPLVGTVAAFRDTPQKRLDVWLEAARAIHEAAPDTHFLLVGDGPIRHNLEAQAADLGLADVVHFAGRQRDVRPFLTAMDIFLMSSAYEGFGIAPVEAMAVEVAVIATDVDGIRNVVTSGETGLLGAFDDNVARTLANLALSLIHDPEARHKLATAGRRAAVANFSIGRMQRELERIYEQVNRNYSKR